MKTKSVVPLNNPNDALDIFKQELMPAVTDVRGEVVESDLGDFSHIALRHQEIPERMSWIRETLQNPEEIWRHWQMPAREVYVNTIFESDDDDEGTLHIVVIERRLLTLKLWTSFVPKFPDTYRERVERGDLLWQPSES